MVQAYKVQRDRSKRDRAQTDRVQTDTVQKHRVLSQVISCYTSAISPPRRTGPDRQACPGSEAHMLVSHMPYRHLTRQELNKRNEKRKEN
jgi:hypothetical protein